MYTFRIHLIKVVRFIPKNCLNIFQGCPDRNKHMDSPDSFLCNDQKKCLRNWKMCNGKEDCEDGSDEWYCYGMWDEPFNCENYLLEHSYHCGPLLGIVVCVT